MTIPMRLREALQKPQPAVALREAVLALKAEGRSQSEISDVLNDLLLEIREKRDDSASEEVVLDTLDAVAGWCHPSARLFPESAA
jgi:hypothetical protein